MTSVTSGNVTLASPTATADGQPQVHGLPAADLWSVNRCGLGEVML